MFVVGLTGGIGSGKTTIATLFAEKGIVVIDADQIARDLLQPKSDVFQQVIARFGSDFLLADGLLNRAALRKKIFVSEKDRVWLEQQLHPLIQQEIQRQVAICHSPYCIVVVPLLFEGKLELDFDRVLVVDALEEQQIERTKQRDGSKKEEIISIIKTQISR